MDGCFRMLTVQSLVISLTNTMLWLPYLTDVSKMPIKSSQIMTGSGTTGAMMRPLNLG
jgi:hypothetical protein